MADEDLADRQSVVRALWREFYGHADGHRTEITDELFDMLRCVFAFGGAPETCLDNDFTMLHVIVITGDARALEVAGWLLECGADVNAKCRLENNGAGRSPLSWAISLSDEEQFLSSDRQNCHAAALFLMERGADIREAQEDYIQANLDIYPDANDIDRFCEILKWQSDFDVAGASAYNDQLNSLISKVAAALAD